MANSQYSGVPELTVMVQAAREIVFAARRQNQLSSLTVKSVRKQVIQDFGLDETISRNEEIKLAIRNAVNDAVSEELPVAVLAETRKRSREDTNAHGDSPPQRGVLTPKADRKQQVVEKGSRKKPRVTAKSKKIESDVDDVDDVDDSPAPKTNPTSASAEKQNAQDGPSASQTETTRRHESAVNVAASVVEAEKQSDSELSVLIDDSPKKKRSKKNKGEGNKGNKGNVPKTAKKGKKEKEPPKPLDKDEAAIKRLKSFVTACGVRKVWSKEFSDLPLASQQINRLKELLGELGMTGKYSMERAKAIKEQRELARELNDVLEYERKAGASGSNRRQSTKTKHSVGELDTEDEAQESGESEKSQSPVMKRKNTASRSIMAYLANQSSGED